MRGSIRKRLSSFYFCGPFVAPYTSFTFAFLCILFIYFSSAPVQHQLCSVLPLKPGLAGRWLLQGFVGCFGWFPETRGSHLAEQFWWWGIVGGGGMLLDFSSQCCAAGCWEPWLFQSSCSSWWASLGVTEGPAAGCHKWVCSTQEWLRRMGEVQWSQGCAGTLFTYL